MTVRRASDSDPTATGPADRTLSPQRLELRVRVETWPMIEPFRFGGHVFERMEVVVVELDDGEHVGCGEASGIFYLNDTPPTMLEQIARVREAIEAGVSRDELSRILPPGGARNAVDCALWDLESRRTATPVWQLAGLQPPRPLLTTYTLGAATPEAMANRAAASYPAAKAMKLKLLGDGYDAERVRAVREARGDVWLCVDGNQSLSPSRLAELLPTLTDARVALIEEPCRFGDEGELAKLRLSIPLAADESVQASSDLVGLDGVFQVINIKLDKCGGLTEAIKMAKEATRRGLQVMVGNMGGTSMGAAPALLLGQYCPIVDLDGPIFLREDRMPTVVYRDGFVSAPSGLFGWSPT